MTGANAVAPITQASLNDRGSEIALHVHRGITRVRIDAFREPTEVAFNPIALADDSVSSWGTPVTGDTSVSPLEFEVRVNGHPYVVLQVTDDVKPAILERLSRREILAG